MDLRELDYSELEDYLHKLGEKTFRAKQLYGWIHNRMITDLSVAHNIGDSLRRNLAGNFSLDEPTLLERYISKDGTEKYLLQLKDGALIECVLMRYRGDFSKQRNTLCISSQVGCAMKCAFCATGNQGFDRNLSVAEILGQIYCINRLINSEDKTQEIRNIVFMGMGEPFNNFENVIKSCDILCHPLGLNLSPRRITISTCGIVPKIYEFTDLNNDLGLAISLHATNDADRDALMPVNHAYPLEELIKACKYYGDITGKRISFEYSLIEGVNDKPKHIKEMKSLLNGLDCHINVIPVNAVSHNKNLKRPKREHVNAFIEALRNVGLGASVRQEKGADINGACGQLKTTYFKEREEAEK